MTTPDASKQTPEHDDLCEIPAYGNQSCHCAERCEIIAEAKALGAEIDPTLLAMRVKRVRQQEKALAAVKHTLQRYIAEHAPARCDIGDHFDCTSEVDGFVLLSCGHHVYACNHGGGRVISTARTHRNGNVCTKRDGLHDGHDAIVTLEWVGL